ncbi:MAG TPA: DUF305 domain-containing protein [Stenomitos sp.]
MSYSLIPLRMGLGVAAIAAIMTACSGQSISQTMPTTMEHGSMHMDNHAMSMDLGPADANLDLRFIDAMIPHHEGAVIMAQAAQQKAQHSELKTLATAIIKAQNAEIDQMKQWRAKWYPNASKTPMAWHADMGHMMAMSATQRQDMMMQQDLGAADAGFDLRFIKAMIPHHEGALIMAQEVLSKTQRPEIKKLAQDILSSQQAEIQQMKTWQQAWSSK